MPFSGKRVTARPDKMSNIKPYALIHGGVHFGGEIPCRVLRSGITFGRGGRGFGRSPKTEGGLGPRYRSIRPRCAPLPPQRRTQSCGALLRGTLSRESPSRFEVEIADHCGAISPRGMGLVAPAPPPPPSLPRFGSSSTGEHRTGNQVYLTGTAI